MITITGEANAQLKSPLNLTRKSDKFRTTNGLIVFPSPSIDTIEKNIFYLLKNSVEKLFDRKYLMKPSYLSYDEYGTQYLGDMLMLVNNTYCLEDFDMSYVIIPKLSALIKINIDNYSSFDKYENLMEIDW